eukprot:scaffold177_cov334-Pavlova_lutheri.AAC.87
MGPTLRVLYKGEAKKMAWMGSSGTVGTMPRTWKTKSKGAGKRWTNRKTGGGPMHTRCVPLPVAKTDRKRTLVAPKATKTFRNATTIVPDPENNRSLWGVAAMGFLWTSSSLMVFSLLPVFLKVELGASNTKIGSLEGVAIAAAFFSKVFSGIVSDILGSRTQVIAFGSCMTAIVKPMFAMATSVNLVFAGKLIDRLSKGVRAAPTDALLADLSPKDQRGSAYGINQSMATLGGVAGAAMASLCMLLTKNNYRQTFMLATIPAALALVVQFLFVRQPSVVETEPATGTPKESKPKQKWSIKDVSQLPFKFWLTLAVVSILYVSRFSEAFVTLRAKAVGWPVAALPGLLIANQLLQSVTTYPLGVLADKSSRKQMLLYGFGVLIAAHIMFIATSNVPCVLLGFMLVGLHMSMTQGNIKALVSESIPANLRGTAFSTFSIVTGIALAFGNILAGRMSDALGSTGCFYGGFVATAIATLLLTLIPDEKKQESLA